MISSFFSKPLVTPSTMLATSARTRPWSDAVGARVVGTLDEERVAVLAQR